MFRLQEQCSEWANLHAHVWVKGTQLLPASTLHGIAVIPANPADATSAVLQHRPDQAGAMLKVDLKVVGRAVQAQPVSQVTPCVCSVAFQHLGLPVSCPCLLRAGEDQRWCMKPHDSARGLPVLGLLL